MCIFDLFFFFFFSSRRRHTRCGRDWSSDVCSSDLKMIGMGLMRSSFMYRLIIGHKNSPKPQGFRAEMRCKKRSCVYSSEAAFRVFNKRETMVMGPTPPGTGVM